MATRTITASLETGFAVVNATERGHRFESDEPEDLGGHDIGPTPYELLLGALASCAIITVKMYCERKDWPLRNVTAKFTHERIRPGEGETLGEGGAGHTDRISSEIVIEGDFDDEAKKRLAQVARRCPVHRTIERGVTFVDDVLIVDVAD